MVTIVVANLVNAALNWVLIFGHLGDAGHGRDRLRLGYDDQPLAAAACSCSSDLAPPSAPSPAGTAGGVAVGAARAMLRLGLPIGCEYALEFGAFAFVALMMGWLGTLPMAGHQVAINLASLTFMVPLGVADAASILVGHAVGRGDVPGTRGAARAALLCGVGFMSCTADRVPGAARAARSSLHHRGRRGRRGDESHSPRRRSFRSSTARRSWRRHSARPRRDQGRDAGQSGGVLVLRTAGQLPAGILARPRSVGSLVRPRARARRGRDRAAGPGAKALARERRRVLIDHPPWPSAPERAIRLPRPPVGCRLRAARTWRSHRPTSPQLKGAMRLRLTPEARRLAHADDADGALAVITVGYIFAYLVFDRLRDRFGYVGGAEYVVIGFLLGPRVTDLIDAVQVQDLTPIVSLALGWLGMLLGTYFRLPTMASDRRDHLRIAFRGGGHDLRRRARGAARPAAVRGGGAGARIGSPRRHARRSRHAQLPDRGGRRGGPAPRPIPGAAVLQLTAQHRRARRGRRVRPGPRDLPSGRRRARRAPPTSTEWAVINLAVGVAAGVLFHLFLGPGATSMKAGSSWRSRAPSWSRAGRATT